MGTVFIYLTLLISISFPSALEVIETETVLAFSDGSSVYQFYDDGRFLLEPVGMSGRSIDGSWTALDSSRFEITGTWGWYNGISAINDIRKMVISVTVLSEKGTESDLLWSAADGLLWDVYFTVDELTSISVP